MAKIKKIYITNENGDEELVYPLTISAAVIHTTTNRPVEVEIESLKGQLKNIEDSISGTIIESIPQDDIDKIINGEEL